MPVRKLLAALLVSLRSARASYGGYGEREPVLSTVVELGLDVETGLDTAATIYCTPDPPEACEHGRMRKPEDAGAPIVVVLPGAARPMDNYSKISEALARSGHFVIVMEQLVDVMVPDDPRIHFSNFTDVNLIPASVIPLALRWIADEYASGSAQILPCETPNQDSVALLGHALGARAAKAMLYLHQPANVIPVGPLTLEFTPQLPTLPYLPQIKGAFCYGLSEPQFAIDEYARHAPPRNDTVFLVANGDLELADIDGGPVIVEDAFNPRDAYLILNDMDHISIVDDALRGNPLSGGEPPPAAAAAPPRAMRVVAERSTRPRQEQVDIVAALAVAAVRVMLCPGAAPPAPPSAPEYVADMFGDSPDLMLRWLGWLDEA